MALSVSQAAVVGGKVVQVFIPTPDASKVVEDYDKLYPKKFSQPYSYIRFSSTVEDTSGCLYSMGEDDEAFLKTLDPVKKYDEDGFERIMQFLEVAALHKQPYLGLNNDDAAEHLASFEELDDDKQPPKMREFAKAVYPHWREERLKRGGKMIIPYLKVSLAK